MSSIFRRSITTSCAIIALGTSLACHPSRAVRAGAALSGIGLILASEKVSFSRVIADTPVLAALDGLGRRP